MEPHVHRRTLRDLAIPWVTTRIAVRCNQRTARAQGRMADGTWQLAVRAKPEAGLANRAVEALLAELLGVAARQVEVARGMSSRSKWVAIEGMSAAEIERRLTASLAAADA